MAAELANELLDAFQREEDEQAKADYLHVLSLVLQQVPEAAPSSLTLISVMNYNKKDDRLFVIPVKEHVKISVGSVDVFGKDQAFYTMKVNKGDGRHPYKIKMTNGEGRAFWSQQQMEHGKKLRVWRIPVKGRRPLFLAP